MAKMGKRDMSVRKPGRVAPDTAAPLPVDFLGVNLIASPIRIQTVAIVDYLPTTLGLPIMREGFITGTGFLPTPPRP